MGVTSVSTDPQGNPTRVTSKHLSARAAGMVCAVIFALAIFAGVAANRRNLAKQRISILEAKLAVAEHERAVKDFALAPFLSLADQQFQDASADQRLALLLERLEALTTHAATLQGPRHLDREGRARILAKLALAPSLDTEIGGVWGNAESLALAQELKALFEEAGFKVRKLAEYQSAELRGVSVFSKGQFDNVLADAIAQLFQELSQRKIQWVNEDLVGTGSLAENPPEVKIIVGVQ